MVSSDILSRLAEKLAGHPNVVLAYVYGSAIRGTAGPQSDLDVAVLPSGPLGWEEERELRSHLERIAPRVDLVLLNEAGIVLAHEIVTDGRCVFARDPRVQAEFEIAVLSKYLDFQPVLRLQEDYLRRRIEERRGSSD